MCRLAGRERRRSRRSRPVPGLARRELREWAGARRRRRLDGGVRAMSRRAIEIGLDGARVAVLGLAGAVPQAIVRLWSRMEAGRRSGRTKPRS